MLYAVPRYITHNIDLSIDVSCFSFYSQHFKVSPANVAVYLSVKEFSFSFMNTFAVANVH